MAKEKTLEDLFHDTLKDIRRCAGTASFQAASTMSPEPPLLAWFQRSMAAASGACTSWAAIHQAAGRSPLGRSRSSSQADMVDNRIEADSLDRHASAARGFDLGDHHGKPGGPFIALGAGLGDEKRSPIAGIGLGKEVAKGFVLGMVGGHWRTAEQPLVIVVVVQSDDIEQLLLPAELRPEAPCDHVESLELREPRALSLKTLIRVTFGQRC